jgi:hypothetical protein
MLSLLATPNKIFMPVSDAVFILRNYAGISLEGWDLLIRIFSLWPRFEPGALT